MKEKAQDQRVAESETSRALRESEERFRAVSELVSDFVYAIRVEPDGRMEYEWTTGALTQVTGFTVEELAQRGGMMSLVHPEDRRDSLRRMRTLRSDHPPTTDELRIITKSGETRWIRNYARPVWDQDQGRIVRIYGAVQDITECKQAEAALLEQARALQESEERLDQFMHSATDQFSLYDSDLTFLDINQAALKMFPDGTRKGDIVGKNLAKVVPDLETSERYEEYLRVIETGEPFFADDVVPPSTFGAKRLSIRAFKVGDGLGLVVRDVTEQVRIEEALRGSEARYRALFEQSLQGIVVSQHSRIVLANSTFAEMMGYSIEELTAMSTQEIIEKLVHPEDRALVVQRYRDRFAGKIVPSRYSSRYVRKDGAVRWMEVSADLVEYQGEPALHAFYVDVTEHKQAEETLQRRNQELALLNRAGRELAATLDLDQVLAAFLDEVCRLLDVTAGSVWLIDFDTDEVVCQQAYGPENSFVQGWRLPLGKGVTGWVALHGQSLVLSDAQADDRYYRGVEREMEVEFHSILSVPLRTRQRVIGTLQVVDTAYGRFHATDLALIESLAATAAIAIENARLYEQTRRDAETKAILLHEVNHRVKNNLAAIIGLIYAEQRHAGIENQAVYQSILENLSHRVQGLAKVHALLSDSGWKLLPLDELVGQIIWVALQILPRHKHISVDVIPSSVQVMPKQANDLALIINELATNTATHALAEQDKGYIKVRITQDEDETVLLEFRDDGPGYPQNVLKSESYNVGLYLVQSLVSHNLCGELTLHNDGGAVATIRFKQAIDNGQ